MGKESVSPTISVIVPVLNEENTLPLFLSQADDWPVLEVIIVDGGSSDRTPSLLLSWSLEDKTKRRFLIAKKGRGRQMNEGARVASGDLFLFLHADSIVPPSGFREIVKALQDADIAGGAFRLKIDSPSLFLKGISRLANLRSSLFSLPYGDQGFFVRKAVFEKSRGYQEWPLMEDVEFIRRLKREGKIVLLKEAMTTSARRWESGGWKVSFRNLTLLLLYFMGVCPKRLGRWYN